MTERKPSAESWESFTERQIRQAQEAGEFSQLPGFGQPIPGIDQPLDENWWLKQKLRNEQLSVVPPVIEARLRREKTLAELAKLDSEAVVRKRLEELNEFIRKAHFAAAAGPATGVLPVEIDDVVVRWKQQRVGCLPDETDSV
ncbi:DUF1992 domain-containing protein [bacterium]|nr:DUF1992 domain-containing protein [bacterium]